VPDVRRNAATRWHPDDAHTALAFLASHLRCQGSDDIAWWRLHHALPPDPAGPLSGPVAGAAIGLGAGCMAGEHFHLTFSPLVRLGCFLAVTLSTAVAATVVIRLAWVADGRGPGGAPRRPAPREPGRPGVLAETGRRLGIGCAVVLPLSAGIGALTERWARAAETLDMGVELGVATFTWVKAGAAWALFMALLALGVLGVSLLRRRRGGRQPPVAGRPTARVRRLLAFAFLFWLGGELAAAVLVLSVRQVAGRPAWDVWFIDPYGDLAFISQNATYHACVFLMIAGIMAGLAPADGATRPTRLDFRAPKHLLLAMLPACLGRGLLLGVLLGVSLAFVTPAAGVSWVVRCAATGTFGVFFGVLFGAGLAVLRWARVPADLEQETPQSTVQGDRTVAGALLVFAMLPPLIKWLVSVQADLPNSDNPALELLGSALRTPEAGLSVGLAAGLLAVAGTAWFAYQETGLRLAAAGRMPRQPLSFMEDARQLSVLRRVGPAYQFCHAQFRHRILSDAAGADGGSARAGAVARRQRNGSRPTASM
jgi:hypothetical protein